MAAYLSPAQSWTAASSRSTCARSSAFAASFASALSCSMRASSIGASVGTTASGSSGVAAFCCVTMMAGGGELSLSGKTNTSATATISIANRPRATGNETTRAWVVRVCARGCAWLAMGATGGGLVPAGGCGAFGTIGTSWPPGAISLPSSARISARSRGRS